MTARQFVLKEPAAIFFISRLRYYYGHHTMVVYRLATSYSSKEDIAGAWSHESPMRNVARTRKRNGRRQAVANSWRRTLAPGRGSNQQPLRLTANRQRVG